MDFKQFSSEITEIEKLMEESPYLFAKTKLIASYFRMFYSKDDTIKAIEEALKNNKDDFAKNFKTCIDISKTNPDDDFLYALSKYRECCVPDDVLEELIIKFTSHINEDSLAFFYELVQNADDCKYPTDTEPTFEIVLNDNGTIKLHHNEIGMTHSDIFAICSAGESNKDPSAIGEKGIGFKTVFAPCEQVDVVSGEYRFSLIDGGFHIEPFEPEEDYGDGTTMILHIREDSTFSDVETLYNDLLEKYGINGDKNAMFCNCPVMYTQNLRRITVRYGDKWFSVSKSDENRNTDTGTVSFTIQASNQSSDTEVENKSIQCFGIYRDVEMDEDTVKSRYSDVDANGYPKQRIEIIAALDEDVNKGNMYSFLPCDQPIKAPLCVNLPIKLNLNRTRMFFIGDSDTSVNNNGEKVNPENLETIAWNYWLIKEFIEMLPRFYEALREKGSLYRYIPDISSGEFFDLPKDKNYMNTYCNSNNLKLVDKLKSIPYFKVVGADEYCIAQNAVLFEKYISNDLNAAPEWAEILTKNGILTKNKKPVEYNDEIIKYGERVGLEKFSYDDDKDYTEAFNTLMDKKPKIRENVFSALYEDKMKTYLISHIKYSILRHINPSELRLYLANLTGKEEYLTCAGDWFISDTLKSEKSCFFHFITEERKTYEKLQYDKKGIVIGTIPLSKTTIDNVEQLLKKISEIYKDNNRLSEEQIDQLCIFLYEQDTGNNSYNINTVLRYCADDILPKATPESYAFASLILMSEVSENAWKYRQLIMQAKGLQKIDYNSGIFIDNNPITHDNFSDNKEKLDKITQRVLDHVNYSIINEKTSQDNNSNIPAYELLQNADDSKRRNRTEGDGIRNDFTIRQENNTITLSYSEAGFTLWDYFCIAGKGNTGNKKTDTNTGMFGSGFKSIYTICPKVEINSRGVKCVLDTENNNGMNDEVADRLKVFPIPEFSDTGEDNGKTEITLFFRNQNNAKIFLQELRKPEYYVFLKNIEYPGEEYPYSRNDEEKGFYYCPKTEDGKKPLFELYFPLPYDKNKSYPLYCGLPMNNTIKLPFMLNIPQIHPTEDRQNISTNEAYLKKNLDILKKVLSAIKQGFDAFAEAYPDTAYKYMPQDMIMFDFNGQTIEVDNYTYCIYPYKHKGKVVGCTSLGNIRRDSIKVFSETFYLCLGLKGVKEKNMNKELKYIDHDIKMIMFGDDEFKNYFTILDTVYNDVRPSSKDCDFINACLPYIREELYSCNDKLYEIVKNEGPKTLAKFNDEDNAAEYFKRGKVAFETLNGYRVCEDENEKFYYIDTKFIDIKNVKNSYSEKQPNFLRKVIIDTNLNSNLISNDNNIFKLTTILGNDDDAKDFLRDEDIHLIEFALTYINFNKDKAFSWLCELLKDQNEPKKEKYSKLLRFVLGSWKNNITIKIIEKLVELIKGSPEQQEYYDALKIAVENCDVDDPELDGFILTNPSGFKIWQELKENHEITFGFDDDSIGNLVRLSTGTKADNHNLYDLYVKALKNIGTKPNQIEYSVFEGDDSEGIPVYFLKNKNLSEKTCCIDGESNDGDILIVIYKYKLIDALEEFLNNECLNGCGIKFKTCDKYARMESNPSEGSEFSGDKLWESGKLPHNLIRTAKEAAGNLMDKNDAEIKKALIGTLTCCGYEFSGYGTETKCPVCGANLFAEASALKVERISVKGRKVPMLMCINCSDFINKYTYDVQLNAEKNTEPQLKFYRDGDGPGGDEPLSVKIRMTFLQKIMIDAARENTKK